MIEKKVFAGMNKDGSPKDLRPEEYRHAENLVAVRDGVGASARLENMLGMRETSVTSFNESVCIGLWNYKAENKIYGFFASSTRHHIIEYDGTTDVGGTILYNNILDFSEDRPVYDVFRIGDLLYFNDGGQYGMRKINIEFARTGDTLNNATDDRVFSLLKTPPLKVTSVRRMTDVSITATSPRIRLTPLQFAQRYVYKDDEISVLSPISEIAPVLDWEEDTNEYNGVEVFISIDDSLEDLIDRVELLVREGNDDPFYIYDDFDPASPVTFLTDNGDGTHQMQYIVFLDRSGATLSVQESGQGAESIPRESSAMELMEDRLFATSSVEEYDIYEEDWDGTININTRGGLNPIVESRINEAVYQPLYYKENSYYTWGVVFFDKHGRKSAPVVRKAMRKQMPDNMRPYSVNISIPAAGAQNGWLLYSHPDQYEVEAAMTGKPPPWAVKYQFARSANQTYNTWFKAKFLVMPLITTEPKTEDPDPIYSDLYLDNGYWYISVHKLLRDYQDNTRDIKLPQFVDLVIPDGFPIAIDKNSIVRLAFDYPVRAGYTGTAIAKRKEYTISQIENGRIRVRGLQWIDIVQTWITDSDAMCGLGFNETTPKQVAENNECFMHFEILNPIKKNNNPLLYEIGEMFDIVDAGTDSRAFSPLTQLIQGDCFYSAYQDLGQFFVDNADESIHLRPKTPTARTLRFQTTVAYASLSPIADRERAGTFTVPLTGEGSSPASGSQVTEQGLYDVSRHNSRGRPTVEVPNQQELRRGGQIRFSRTFIQDSLINGLSNFPEENKYTLPSDRGDIVKLVASNENVLVAVHSRAITSIYINRAILQTGEGTPFISKTDQVIGDDQKLLLSYGTKFPESVVLHDSRVYGFDGIMSEPWRRSQDGITPLALTFGMKTYFEAKGELIRYIQTVDPTAKIRVLGGFDPWLDMYVLTFSEISWNNGVDDVIEPAETIGFSEKVKKWVSFYSFYPEYYSTIMNSLVSVKDKSLWRHMDTMSRNLFYGEYHNSSITIVGNESNDLPKTHQNLGLSSSEEWSMTCITPEGKQSKLDIANFTDRDGVYYADFLRDELSPADNLKAGQTPLLHGEKMIGETIEITLTNGGSDRVVLDAVYIGYSPMVGHLLAKN